MNVLITGGAGFIGLHLSKHLADCGYKITIIDNFERITSAKNLDDIPINDSVSFINADITLPQTFDNLTKDYDYIYHLAAINGTPNFYSIPDKVLKVGVLGVLNILDWFAKRKSGKLLFSSSSETYSGGYALLGKKFPFPTPEDVPLIVSNPKNVRWSYGASKILGEVAMYSYAKAYNFDNFVIVRYHNVYGPRMGYDHVIPQFIKRIVKKQNPFKIFGYNETRAFCYISDAIKATQMVMESSKTKGDIINIGRSDEEIKIRDLAKKLFKIAGVDPKIEIEPSPEGSALRRCPDTRKLKNLGFAPEVPLEDGLKICYDWYKNIFLS